MEDGAQRLLEAARRGDARAVGRLISLVEDADPRDPQSASFTSSGENPYVVGLTGAPGVGKSTTTSALIAHWRGQQARVGVLAVDPSSPFTGGALLGDRVRMQAHATDPGVYVRSMASRGQLGGLAAATPAAIRVLGAACFDVVLVETVGVGQAEVDIAGAADTTVVLVAPGMGDGVQAAKAGLLEAADVLVVNKADRPGADETVSDLRHMVSLVPHAAGAWRVPVARSVAVSEGGVAEVVEAIEKHRGWLASSGEGERRRTARAAREIRTLALAMLSARFRLEVDDAAVVALAARVMAGELDAAAAARSLTSEPETPA